MNNNDGAKLSELIGICIQSSMEKNFLKNQTGLYGDDEIVIFRNINTKYGQNTEEYQKHF